MTRDDITDRARRCVVKHFAATQSKAVNPEQVTALANFIDDLGGDSLDAIEITMEIEEEFDIEITDAEATDAQTFGGLVDLVERKLKVAAA